MIDQSGFRPAGGRNGTGVSIDFGPALYFFRRYIKFGAGLPVSFPLEKLFGGKGQKAHVCEQYAINSVVLSLIWGGE